MDLKGREKDNSWEISALVDRYKTRYKHGPQDEMINMLSKNIRT